ncbi:hypothetical protein N0V83_009486 [Neocucurbitaria cava]|uniref:Uncharacterized protein n=1 Tax=Neocucurbitaria cava TaxID=798079 RepID=A0A9W8Y268_9PLEO|nr:hypothetical protein N0V83_009486 [Neocucurbitaria cava]
MNNDPNDPMSALDQVRQGIGRRFVRLDALLATDPQPDSRELRVQEAALASEFRIMRRLEEDIERRREEDVALMRYLGPLTDSAVAASKLRTTPSLVGGVVKPARLSRAGWSEGDGDGSHTCNGSPLPGRLHPQVSSIVAEKETMGQLNCNWS